MPDLLEIDSVIKSFGTKQVLTDICLKCQTGDIIGILGRNGSGKSSLLKILFGTMSAENKFIRINNKIYHRPYKAGKILCYLPEETFLPHQLSVQKAVELFLGKNQLESFLDDPLIKSFINVPLKSNKVL